VRRILFLIFLFAAGPASAQQVPPPAAPNIDAPGELDKLKENCGDFKKFGSCAQELFTGQPIHIAVGSIAPQNGFGAGVAYVGHKTTDNWRINWNADAIGSNNSSWRAGFYMKFVDTHEKVVGHHFGTQKIKPNLTELPEHAVINVYAQVISLNKLTYFGLGPATTEGGCSFYGMRQIIVGVSGVKPFYQRLNAGLYGEVNGRLVRLRPSQGQPSPSIELLYNEATAPGLTNQTSVVQLGEGIRIRPVYFDDFVRLNYDLAYRQYFAQGTSGFSFQRLTIDLSHQFAIYRQTTRMLLPRDANGPDECSLDPASKHPECREITRDLEGSVGMRFFLAASMTSGGNVVPFYFQPTLGGADINGNASLSSYQDYRFRAPNILLLQQSFEHSIGKLPLGFALMADEGKVALTRSDLGSNNWVHSFSAGLTLRAGGFPQVYLLFSWGGNEGTHTIANVNTSLLGGSARPSLY